MKRRNAYIGWGCMLRRHVGSAFLSFLSSHCHVAVLSVTDSLTSAVLKHRPHIDARPTPRLYDRTLDAVYTSRLIDGNDISSHLNERRCNKMASQSLSMGARGTSGGFGRPRLWWRSLGTARQGRISRRRRRGARENLRSVRMTGKRRGCGWEARGMLPHRRVAVLTGRDCPRNGFCERLVVQGIST